jgi:hypothetical protein
MTQFENDTWAFDYSDGLTPDNEKSIVAIVSGVYTSFPCNGEHSIHLEYLKSGRTPADWTDPRTAQQIYDEDVLAPLDAAVLKDAARMVEDFYDALVGSLPQSMKDKHGPLMADRKAKRVARP